MVHSWDCVFTYRPEMLIGPPPPPLPAWIKPLNVRTEEKQNLYQYI